VQASILERLVGTYVAAYVVPVGAKADATLKGAADDPSGLSEELPEAGISEGMRESLDMLRNAGVFGKLYAFLFEHTGILDRDYPLFDEVFPFSEPREDRLERIIELRQLVAARDAAISGAESQIPVARIVVSCSHRKLLDFRNKMRLGIEIASLYGIDIREGPTQQEVSRPAEQAAVSCAFDGVCNCALRSGQRLPPE
jgi:hypothetical protein